ncbi:MAG: tetratricopeptide repeat protein, partial [Cyanobacteria bacterium]|nr:tetratricopeptide repeat protein [Cyanobacteriota bacterium]
MSIKNRIFVTGLASLLAVNSSTAALSQDEKAPKPLTPLAREILNQAQDQGGSTMSEVRPKNVRQLTEVLEAPRTPESIDKVDKLLKSGMDFFDKADYQDALLRWQEAYGMSIEMKYSQGQGKALVGMCKVYLTQGKWVKARHLGENAVEVLSAINDEVWLGKARIALAQAYFGLDNPLWALRQLDLAMKHLLTRPDTDSGEAAALMKLAGSLALRFNKLKEAICYFQESAKYSAQGGDLPQALTMHCKIAGLLSELGFYVASLEEAQKAMSVAKRAKNDRATISALASLANAQYVLGEFRDANRSYDEAYRLAGKYDETVLPKEGKANLLMGYAFSLIAVGEEEQAEKILAGIIPYFERCGRTYPQAECLNALGVMHANNGDSFKAVTYFDQSLDLQGLIKPARVRMQMMILCNIAAAEFRVGKYRDALNHLRTVMPILAKNPKDYHVIRTRLFVSLAEVALKLGDKENAQKYLDAALRLGKESSDDMALWRALTVQAQIQLDNKEEGDAKETLIEALSHFRSPQAGNFPSAEFLKFMSTRREYGQQLVALLASQG